MKNALKRNTVQKTIVYNTVMNMKCHPTAEDVYHKIENSHPTVGRATVFRNLKTLSEEGKIKRISVPGGADRYDFNLSLHCHFKCRGCGKIYDMTIPEMNNLGNLIHNKRDGFTIEGYHLVFSGLCPDCKNII